MTTYFDNEVLWLYRDSTGSVSLKIFVHGEEVCISLLGVDLVSLRDALDCCMADIVIGG